jgi:hypothetical protein
MEENTNIMLPNAMQLQEINKGNFELAQRKAKLLASSNLVPKAYINNVANCMIAIEMAQRIGASELMVMQHLNIIYGTPSWSSTFLIAAINTCVRFETLKFRFTGEKGTDSWGCIAYTKDKYSGEILEGAEITISIAKKEGWFDKNGSKWKSIPQLMLQYRSAAFFSRVYCPEITMGMQTADEVIDVGIRQTINIDETNNDKELERILEHLKTITTLDDLEAFENSCSEYPIAEQVKERKQQIMLENELGDQTEGDKNTKTPTLFTPTYIKKGKDINGK